MKCENVQTIINESSNSELGLLDPKVSGHIDSCEGCRASYDVRIRTSEVLKSSSPSVKAGAVFTQRLLDAIDREAGTGAPARAGRQQPKPSFWRSLFQPSPAWAAVALVLVLVSGYNYIRTMGYFSPTGEMPANMAVFVRDVGHDAYLYTRDSQTYELETSDPGEVRQWFAPRLDFPVNAPAGMPGGFEMKGARLWHTVSRLSAMVCYQTDDGDRVSLFVISADNLADTGASEVRRDGRTYHTGESFQFNVVSWQEGDAAYALVGKISIEALLDLVAAYSP